MVPWKFWRAASSTPDSSATGSIQYEYKPEKGAFLKGVLHSRRNSAIVVSIIILLIGLVLGLSLGLTLGLRHGHHTNHTALPVVDLGYSRYQGNDFRHGVSQWLGIRYAAAPLAELRFAAPQDPPYNATLQKANQHGPTCLGTRSEVSDQPISQSQSEDCLFLDVYAPSNFTTDSKFPVYFFIQGGGFNSNADPNLNGTSLVKASGFNIVIVNFNYRVSLYGFLASAEIQRSASLNNGLLDQRKALQWVQDHISKFGGDPGHVVMGGASAGAGSVALQVGAYGGRDDNLFHATAAESQSFGAVRTVSGSQYQYDELVNRTKCAERDTGYNDTLACLRGLSSQDLQKQNIGTPFPGADQNPLFSYNPVVDNDFLQDLTLALFEDGRFHNVPAIYGDVTNEGTIFVPKSTDSVDDSNSFIRAQFPLINSTQLSTIQSLYKPSAYPHYSSAGEYWRSTAAAYGELRYVCTGDYISSQYYAHNRSSRVYSYHYNVTDPASLKNGYGVPHVAELNAIWDPPSAPASYKPGGSNADVVPLMQSYWTSFIRFYDPNVARLPGSPTWDQWGGPSTQRRILIQGGGNAVSNTAMETVPADQKKRCAQLNQWGISLRQ